MSDLEQPTQPGPPPRRPGTPLVERPTSSSPADAAVLSAGDEAAWAASGTALAGPSDAAGAEGGGPVDRPVRASHQHVWVAPTPGGSGQPHAGLLHLWRRTPAGWQGRVTYLVDAEDQIEPVHVTSWMPAAMIRQA